MGFPALNATGSTAVLVVGAGPAGLMAAEQLSNAGIAVHVCDAMPSVGRKFLRAGIGGLNLTHAENAQSFRSRYSHSESDVDGVDGKGVETVSSWLQDFDADALRRWAQQLGVETFVGSSGRVFPVGLKAAPLLFTPVKWVSRWPRFLNKTAGFSRGKIWPRNKRDGVSLWWVNTVT